MLAVAVVTAALLATAASAQGVADLAWGPTDVLSPGAGPDWFGSTAAKAAQGNAFTLANSGKLTLTATNVQTGARAWLITVTDDVLGSYQSVSVFEKVVTVSLKYLTQAFDAKTGTRLWKQPYPAAAGSNAPHGIQIGSTAMLFAYKVLDGTTELATGSCFDETTGTLLGTMHLAGQKSADFATNVDSATAVVAGRNEWATVNATCGLSHRHPVYNGGRYLFDGASKVFFHVYSQWSSTDRQSGARAYDMANPFMPLAGEIDSLTAAGAPFAFPSSWLPPVVSGDHLVVAVGRSGASEFQVWNWTNGSLALHQKYAGLAYDSTSIVHCDVLQNATLLVTLQKTKTVFPASQTLLLYALAGHGAEVWRKPITYADTEYFVFPSAMTDGRDAFFVTSSNSGFTATLYDSATGAEVFVYRGEAASGTAMIETTITATGDRVAIFAGGTFQRRLSALILRKPLPTPAPLPPGTPAPPGAPGGNSAWFTSKVVDPFTFDRVAFRHELVKQLAAAGVTLSFADIVVDELSDDSIVMFRFSGLEQTNAADATLKFTASQWSVLRVEAATTPTTPAPTTVGPTAEEGANNFPVAAVAAGAAAAVAIAIVSDLRRRSRSSSARRLAQAEAPMNSGMLMTQDRGNIL
jgi:outer membrane protein assembly factor BamB